MVKQSQCRANIFGILRSTGLETEYDDMCNGHYAGKPRPCEMGVTAGAERRELKDSYWNVKDP